MTPPHPLVNPDPTGLEAAPPCPALPPTPPACPRMTQEVSAPEKAKETVGGGREVEGGGDGGRAGVPVM